MRALILLLIVATIVAAFFAFSGLLFDTGPIYAEPVTLLPYEFSRYLFWTLMLMLVAAIIIGSLRKKPAEPPSPTAQSEVNKEERAISGGFAIACLFVVVAFVSAAFGFGAVASTFANLALIIFWVSLIVALFALAIGIFERRPPPK